MQTPNTTSTRAREFDGDVGITETLNMAGTLTLSGGTTIELPASEEAIIVRKLAFAGNGAIKVKVEGVNALAVGEERTIMTTTEALPTSLSMLLLVDDLYGADAEFSIGSLHRIVNASTKMGEIACKVAFSGDIDVSGEVLFPERVEGAIPLNHTTCRGNYWLGTTSWWTPEEDSVIPAGSSLHVGKCPGATSGRLTVEGGANLYANDAKVDNGCYLTLGNYGVVTIRRLRAPMPSRRQAAATLRSTACRGSTQSTLRRTRRRL